MSIIHTYLDFQKGLGDLIVCNGLIRELSRIHKSLVVPCYPHNLGSAKSMFYDLENVQFWTDENHSEQERLIIGQNNPNFRHYTSFDVAMYALAGVPIECRWSSFHVPSESIPIKSFSKPFRLFHHDPSRGYSIRDSYFDYMGDIVIFKTKSITDWIPYIEQASEIHCIDSSILHLVESIDTKANLFYHKYARQSTLFDCVVKRKDWNVIE